MAEPFIGARYLEPYLRPFPVWRYGPICDKLDGRYLRDGWYPDRFGAREVAAPKRTKGAS
jgi:hypothetical protein